MSNQLADLAAALERVESVDGNAPVASLIATIRQFLIPRLVDPPLPLVVAIVGSTGAGKSTLVNSLAGSPVSNPGVLRPTTNESVVWTDASHAGHRWPGKVVVGDHPLAASIALIDTPDLDSNVVDHRLRAMEALSASDAVVFVTTSSRYGDASPWDVLRSVAGKPLAVVVNRLQTRASGARTDLISRLRGLGLGSVPVLTISEQRIDPARGRLSPQSVQRLGSVLKEWAGQSAALRLEGMERAADELGAALGEIIERLEDRSARAGRAAKEVTAAYETGWQRIEVLTKPAQRRKRLRASRRKRDLENLSGRVVDEVDGAASVAAAVLENHGFHVSADLRTASRSAAHELSRYLAEPAGSDREILRRVLDEDRQRFLEKLVLLPDGVLERLHNGADLIDDLDWRSV